MKRENYRITTDKTESDSIKYAWNSSRREAERIVGLYADSKGVTLRREKMHDLKKDGKNFLFGRETWKGDGDSITVTIEKLSDSILDGDILDGGIL